VLSGRLSVRWHRCVWLSVWTNPEAVCYNVAHKFEFDAKLLRVGENMLLLSLPYGAENYESALLPESVYVQYDALRLEVE
jgi:hypothetical protein